MTPLAEIKNGILESDWIKVISGYNKLTGENISIPKREDISQSSLQEMYEEFARKKQYGFTTQQNIESQSEPIGAPEPKMRTGEKAPVKTAVKKKTKRNKTKFISE